MPQIYRPRIDTPGAYNGLMEALAAIGPLTIQEYAEEVVEIHWGVATSNNVDVASSNSEIYCHSQANLLAMIRMAYPHVNAQEVYDVWIDSMESLSYCVRAWTRWRTPESD